MSDEEQKTIREALRLYRQCETQIDKLNERINQAKENLKDFLGKLDKVVPFGEPVVIRMGNNCFVLSRESGVRNVQISKANVA